MYICFIYRICGTRHGQSHTIRKFRLESEKNCPQNAILTIFLIVSFGSSFFCFFDPLINDRIGNNNRQTHLVMTRYSSSVKLR